MKKTTKITIRNFSADGTEIKDLSKVVIPPDNPIYDIMATIIKRTLQSQEIDKGE